jgi:hypothetical protein
VADTPTDNSMAPDLDPPAPATTYPSGVVGDLMRQRNLAVMARESARALVDQYQTIVDSATSQIAGLDAAIEALNTTEQPN